MSRRDACDRAGSGRVHDAPLREPDGAEAERPLYVPARLRRPTPPGFTPRASAGAPLVSVVTVARNAAATIGGTLASVAAQRFPDLEHIVVDGGSTDGTCGLVLAARHRPRLVSDSDHGIYHAFNRGLALARGRWIHFLNADDAYAHPYAVETVMEHARRAPRVGVWHADMYLDDAPGAASTWIQTFDSSLPLGFDLEMPISHPTAFVARWVYASLGGFDATYRLSADYELVLRMHLAGIELRHIPQALVRMRRGGASDIGADLGTLESMRAWYRLTGRPPWRRLVHELRAKVLDRWTPTLSRALITVKHRTVGPRAWSRHPVQAPGAPLPEVGAPHSLPSSSSNSRA